MKKVFCIFTGLLLISGTYLLFFSDFMKADGCLDSGGGWDYKDNVCRKAEPNA